MEDNSSFRVTPQLVLGFFIILIGILFTLDTLGVIEARDYYFRLWPTVIIAVGLTKLSQPKSGRGLTAGAVITLVGILWLFRNLGVIHFSIWRYWPLLLVALGAAMVWRAFVVTSRVAVGHKPDIPADSDETISAIAVMGGVVRNCTSKDFRGGEITAIMGGCEIDLRESDIQREEAVIHVFAWWGGIEIRVPEDWTVVSKGLPLLGGFEDTTRAPRTGVNKRLVLTGFAIMGGVEIKN